MRQRGDCDGIFTVKMAIQKRQEYGLSTFGVVHPPYQSLLQCPSRLTALGTQKFGFPPQIPWLIINFCSDLLVEVKGEDW